MRFEHAGISARATAPNLIAPAHCMPNSRYRYLSLLILLAWLTPHNECVAAEPLPAKASVKSAATQKSGLPLPALGTEVVINAEQIHGLNDKEAIAEGNVELIKRDARLEADKLIYRSAEDEVEATGNVRLSRDGDRVSGPHLKMQLSTDTGVFDEPTYQIQSPVLGGQNPSADSKTKKNPLPTGRGHAKALNFQGKGQYQLTDATYSTCTPATDGRFDWFAKVADLKLDYTDETGTGKHTTVYFKDVPILYSPWLSFPLNNRRKTGLLSPTIGSSSNTGFELTQPFYWNIAPDMDATISPRLMSKRGLQIGNEFRYLGATYSGTTQLQVLPHDSVTNTDRWSLAWRHAQDLGGGFNGNINLNSVSDDTYFSDLGTRLTSIERTHLVRQAELGYASNWWRAGMLVQEYQTLQDPNLPLIGKPYRRLPQFTLNAGRYDLPLGMETVLNAEYVNFQHLTLAQGQRMTMYPQLSLPIQTSAVLITPKIGFKALHYAIDQYQRFDAAGPASYTTSLSVPIASVDSSVVFERPATWLGREMIQTLEPRLYYLYAPARDQSKIPLFDTAATDFNFAQIFSESRYIGGDRIADANQITGMVSSRFIDPSTGAELIRAGFGQRFYFADQKVGLPGEALRTDRKTDILAAVSGRVVAGVYLDTAWQYNPQIGQTQRFNVGTRYEPEDGKVLNLSYRYAREVVGAPLSGFAQIDISGQWPLGNGWHGIGRYNYSTRDNRVIETLGGVEYNGGCWVARGVIQRSATQLLNSNTTLFFQLELNDFSRIGSNPLDLLKRSVRGYDAINSRSSKPVFDND